MSDKVACIDCGSETGAMTLCEPGWVHDDPKRCVRGVIYRGTHGDPPDRACLPGSEEKWAGYQQGVEDAIAAAESFLHHGPERWPA